MDKISNLLKAQYTLAYYPQRIDKVRKIEVRVNRDGVKISARRTVGSENGGGAVHFSVTSCEVSAKEHPYPWESRMTSTDSGPLIYQEDFSDPQSGWPNRHEPQMDAHYTRGEGYSLSRWLCPGSASAAGGEFIAENDYVIAAYGPWWDNFSATTSVQLHLRGQGCSTPTVGMVFHVMERVTTPCW